jgi:nicotinamidase-related amidase
VKKKADERARSKLALLLIDVINAFDFEGSEGLVRAATAATPHIRALAERARGAGVPVVYVNDNFGQWRSDFKSTIAGCTRAEAPGREVSAALAPEPDDYFVLKPGHSGFYCTALELLLDELEVETLILAGFATNICVLHTAIDAHMRKYRVLVPADTAGSNSEELTRLALAHLREVSAAETPRSSEIDFTTLSTAGAT